MWDYWPLKFPNKSTAIANKLPDSDVFRWDEIDEINMGTEFFVNIAVVGDIPNALQPYVIPFPLHPKRVYFVNNEGVM